MLSTNHHVVHSILYPSILMLNPEQLQDDAWTKSRIPVLTPKKDKFIHLAHDQDVRANRYCSKEYSLGVPICDYLC